MPAASNVDGATTLLTKPMYLPASDVVNFVSTSLCCSPTATVLLGLAVLVSFIYYLALPKPLPGIPYSKKSRWKPFGDAFDFVQYTKETGEGLRWFATKSAELNSPVFQVFLGPFARPIVVVADIQEIIDMSTRRNKEFDRGGFLTKWVGVLFPEGTISMPSHDKFKLQRSTWASTMTSQFLNGVSAQKIHQHTRSLVKLWETKYRLSNGRPYEVSDDIKNATFDMVCTVLVLALMIWTAATGDDLGLITRRINAAEKSDDIKAMSSSDMAVDFHVPHDVPEIVGACTDLVEHLKNMRGSVWLAATKIWISLTPSWNRAWKIKEDFMLELLDTSRQKFSTAKGADREAACAMDQIFKREALAEAKGKRMSHREMIDETFAYIVGGHDTTQDTTKWSLKYLTANQDKQRKLRSALLELFPGTNANNLPSADAIIASEHPYVEASIQELIRIALTAPSVTRRTTQEVVLLGHIIPAGIDVFGAPSVQSYEDMDDFDISDALRSPTSRARTTGKWERATKGLYQPERWINPENGAYNHYAGPMLPFGAGTRGCFGQRLARLELRIMIIMLVLSFEFEPIPEVYASFRAEEVVNRGPHITYIRPILRV